MKISQKLQLDAVSNQTIPYQTKPYQTKPYQTIPNLINPNQLNIFSKTVKRNQILMKISQKFQMDVVSNHTQPNQTLPNQL